MQPSILEPGVDFAVQRIVTTSSFLERQQFEELREELHALAFASNNVDRSYIPSHKKGGTIGHDVIREKAPRALAFYHSDKLKKYIF